MVDKKYEKVIALADELLAQVRAEALVSLRFLDVALYKLKFNTILIQHFLRMVNFYT